MRKLVLFMHISLDGYTTDREGRIDWVNIDQEMFDFALERTQKADTALYGRGTYEIMENYWPTAGDKPDATKHDTDHSRWYNGVEKVIVSTTLEKGGTGKTRIIRDDPAEEIRKLKQGDGKEIIMFGSPTLAHTLMREKLIDDYWLFIDPLLLGEGTPLFDSLGSRQNLRLVFSQVFASGVVCLHYTAQAG